VGFFLFCGFAVSKRPHIVVATPGRAAALVTLGVLVLNKLSFLVMDEADRLLFHGFEHDLSTIIRAANAKVIRNGWMLFFILRKKKLQRQTMLFSATMTPTLEVLQSMAMRKPFRWDQSKNAGALVTVKKLRQEYILTPADARDAYLVYLVRVYSSDNVAMILFCSSVEETALIFHMMDALVDVKCVQLHSMMRQEERTEAMAQYRSGAAKILVATDVASRGLDIPSNERFALTL
jgi:ATP-dependent RNA helicase DDX49/DBP8